MTFQPSVHSNPGVRAGAGPATGTYYVTLAGERGRHPDGWHWGILMGRVPETIKLKGPLVPGQRVQFKRLHKDTSVKWGVYVAPKRMPEHGGRGYPGPGLASYDRFSYHPGARQVVPPAVPNPRPQFGPGIWSGYWFMDRRGRCWEMPMGMRGWVPSRLRSDGAVVTDNGAVYMPVGLGDCDDRKRRARKNPDYGWSAQWPVSKLTVSATASREGLSNQPDSAVHQANLSLLSDFLGRLNSNVPFTVSSGYRSSAVNTAVGGSSTSQHPNGLAVDLTPTAMTNQELAAWLYANRDKFPELDQVIWYEDTTHVHIGICPSGATGCPRSSGPRGEFLKARKEGSLYYPWAPDAAAQAAMAAKFAYRRPLKTYVLVAGAWILAGGLAVSYLGLLSVLKKRKKQRRGE